MPGEQVADAYLDWMLRRAETLGAVLVAENNQTFVGFVAGWIEETENIGETPDSKRIGFVSDICVMPQFRGREIASELLKGIGEHLRGLGAMRLRMHALAANRSARAAYERTGFAPYEIIYEKTSDVGD
jgi:ribosomal protein S18 acetylase RimI-like enzyme